MGCLVSGGGSELGEIPCVGWAVRSVGSVFMGKVGGSKIHITLFFSHLACVVNAYIRSARFAYVAG